MVTMQGVCYTRPRVLSLEEVKSGKGAGWMENWVEPDEGPEIKELLECAWIRGAALVYYTMGYTDYASEGEFFDRMYGKKYGFRIWTGRPSPALMESEPWEL